ncbi:MAG TPA: class I SAM-dependent methyltransferase [Candidatus Atribacteria bacterium]|nr:class I SAM-dependent methyltransferase [Candidatus Atribacteria bacterium]HPT78580.1 class I SAM-dependent methyltransferase [Candidatus Atribacteria bacterium]
MADKGNDRTGDIFSWIEKELDPKACTTEDLIYNDMESQSAYSLPVIYQPFDAAVRWHWSDRGSLYDFLYTTRGEGKRLLDFGPGDGWPSLLVAPFVKEVVGVDSSPKRVETCIENARRLGISNARFVSYRSGSRLPFEDDSFDGIMAASSIEQTPDPKQTLSELYRVLKPGGRIRIFYETLGEYKGGLEYDIWIFGLAGDRSKLILYKRDPEHEYALQYGLTIAIPEKELKEKLSVDGEVSFRHVTEHFLEGIKGIITSAQVCKTIHPSGRTLVSWLKEIGFKEVVATYSGSMAAARLFDSYAADDRPSDLESVDEAVRKVVKVVTELEAPIELDPMITGIK